MTKFIKIALALFLFTPAFALFAKETKNILFIAGNTKHRHGFHEFKAGSMLLADALNKSKLGINAKVHWYGWPEDESIFKDVDAVIIYADKGGELEEKHDFLDKKIKEGMGIMFMHYGVHPTKEAGEKYFKKWIGGYFDDEFSTNPSWIADITPKKGHAVARGVELPLKVYDELYFNMNMKENCADCYPLATAIPTAENMIRYGSNKFWSQSAADQLGKEQALIWCHDAKNAGRGAGFVGGHYHNNWAVDNYRKLVLNTIAWVAGVDIPSEGIKSAKVTKAMLNQSLNRPDYPEQIELPSPELLKQAPGKPYAIGPDGRAIDPRKKKKASLKSSSVPKKTSPVKLAVASSINEAFPWPPAKLQQMELELFKADGELEVTRWAASPQVYNPTNMDIDHMGNIWVAEGVNYRRENMSRRKDGDRIVVLRDTNGDGTADKSHTFYQNPNLSCPLGIAVLDNKIVVSQPPELIVLTDANRNLVFDEGIDKKEVLLTGFNGRQHDHSLHSLTAGPDGKWYFNAGNCGAIFTDKSGKTFRMNTNYRGGAPKEFFYTPTDKLGGAASDDGFVWSAGFTVRMNPDGTNVEIVGHGFRNSYEQTINSLGETFQSDNDDYSSCRNSYVLEYGSAGYYSLDGQYKWQSEKRSGQSIPRAHWRQDNPGTFDTGDVYGAGGPTGVTFYENGALGDKYKGLYLSCEATRNIVYGYFPKQQGASYELKRFDFLSSHGHKSTEHSLWFRPSDVCIGPDGAIYVADFYDPRSGGHATLDPTASGAIYRIAPKNFKPVIPKLNLKTITGQIEALKNPAVNVRYIGFRELKKTGSKAYAQVAKLLEHDNEFIAARAIWLLPHLGKKGLEHCYTLLENDQSNTRLVAYRALRRAEINILPYAKILAEDANTAIRRDVALSLRNYSAEETGSIFVDLVNNMPKKYDKNYVEAIGLGATNKEKAIWNFLRKELAQQSPLNWSKNFARITWRFCTPAAIADLRMRIASDKLSIKDRKFAAESMAFINHEKAALALIDLAKLEGPLKDEMTHWVFMRRLTSWSKLDIAEAIKDIYDPEKIVVTPMTIPAEPEVKTLDQEKILALKGDVHRGKDKIMSCTMCHNIDDVGPNYGPVLKGWASKQTREATVNAIVAPSSGIAHGFKGIEVLLKDGKKVQGIPDSKGDPMIIVSTAGVKQIIPKAKIAKTTFMKQSLMLSAQQLGLNEQDVADIVAYMKSWK